MGYRVNNVPWLLKPFFWLYSYGLGFLACLLISIFRVSCCVRTEGDENLRSSTNAIFAYWHNHNIPSFVAFFYRNKNIVAFNHPGWYMKPVHIILSFLGTRKIIMGASGVEGRKAADEVVSFLQDGHSTFINPDGPNGPPLTLKKGALHMAEQSGIPIIPVKFLTSRELALKKTWDGKRIPIPFSTIIIKYGKPIFVTKETFEASQEALKQAL